ncbi:MAG: hypothetical protein OEY14_02410 [Myxococcales bacterium]|nr:hypothetical protein [Myxococcales bacterium]
MRSIKNFAFALATGALLASPLLAGGARAEPPPGGYQDGSDPGAAPQGGDPTQPYANGGGDQVQPYAGGGPGQPYAQTPDEEGASEGRGIQYGAHLLFPVWLTEPVAGYSVNPGIALHGRIGWEFPGGLAAELGLGVMGNEVLHVSDETLDYSLTGWWISGGGRFSFLNPSALVPFVGAALQINVWNECPTGSCTADSYATVAVVGTAGLIWEMTADLGIEAGINATISAPGDVFESSQTFISPFAGATLYY